MNQRENGLVAVTAPFGWFQAEPQFPIGRANACAALLGKQRQVRGVWIIFRIGCRCAWRVIFYRLTRR